MRRVLLPPRAARATRSGRRARQAIWNPDLMDAVTCVYVDPCENPSGPASSESAQTLKIPIVHCKQHLERLKTRSKILKRNRQVFSLRFSRALCGARSSLRAFRYNLNFLFFATKEALQGGLFSPTTISLLSFLFSEKKVSFFFVFGSSMRK